MRPRRLPAAEASVGGEAGAGAAQCVAPESVPAMAKARGALSLRQARAYAASLPAGEHSMGGCYTHRCVGCGCDGACVGCSYNAGARARAPRAAARGDVPPRADRA